MASAVPQSDVIREKLKQSTDPKAELYRKRFYPDPFPHGDVIHDHEGCRKTNAGTVVVSPIPTVREVTTIPKVSPTDPNVSMPKFRNPA